MFDKKKNKGGSMTSDTQMYEDRFHIINYFFSQQLSVTELCKIFNRSRTWFYKWKRRYDQYGKAGLRNIDRSPPAMPNRTPLDIEMKILDFITTYPTYGPQRIANEFTMKNIPVKPSAVYNVLKRYNLNTRKHRLEYMRIKNGVVSTTTDLERDKDKSKSRSLDTRYPGHIIGMDVFYVGTLKGVGRIFQFTAIDTYSSYAWAKLYTDKSAVSACDFMMHVYNNNLDVPIQSVLTDNGLEFTTHHTSKNHSFERLVRELAIKHRLTKVRHPWTNGACERLNRTLLEEFYQVAFRTKIYQSVLQLNDDLNRFIEFYNCQRTHQGKRTKGKVPAELYLLTKTKAA
jgi:transposase InsO family protein